MKLAGIFDPWGANKRLEARNAQLEQDIGDLLHELRNAEHIAHERAERRYRSEINMLRSHLDHLIRQRVEIQNLVPPTIPRLVLDTIEQAKLEVQRITGVSNVVPMRHRCITCAIVDGHMPGCPENIAPEEEGLKA